MRDTLQTGCLAAGVLCLSYFIVIAVYAGIHTSLIWIWVCAGAFFLALNRILVYLSVHPGSWLHFLCSVMLTLIAVGVLVIVVFGGLVISAMATGTDASPDYVIVLGAQVRGTSPSRALRRRLDKAVEYAAENPDAIFVLSGGQGPDEGISEAECMYQYLTSKGVSAERLILEDRSTSTEENLQYSAELINKTDNIGIISNNFHIYRALALARAQGYSNVVGIPASADGIMQPHNILREICCILVELIDGTISISVK